MIQWHFGKTNRKYPVGSCTIYSFLLEFNISSRKLFIGYTTKGGSDTQGKKEKKEKKSKLAEII